MESTGSITNRRAWHDDANTTDKAMGVKSRLNAEQSIRGGARYLERMLERVQ